MLAASDGPVHDLGKWLVTLFVCTFFKLFFSQASVVNTTVMAKWLIQP